MRTLHGGLPRNNKQGLPYICHENISAVSGEKNLEKGDECWHFSEIDVPG